MKSYIKLIEKDQLNTKKWKMNKMYEELHKTSREGLVEYRKKETTCIYYDKISRCKR